MSLVFLLSIVIHVLDIRHTYITETNYFAVFLLLKSIN